MISKEGKNKLTQLGHKLIAVKHPNELADYYKCVYIYLRRTNQPNYWKLAPRITCENLIIKSII